MRYAAAMNTRSLLATTAVAIVSFWAGTIWAQKPDRPPLESHIWKAGDARLSKGA